MPGPTPDQFNLVVSNMEASVAFYRRLGLNIADPTPEWQRHHRSAELSSGVALDLDSPVRQALEPWLVGRHGGARLRRRRPGPGG